MKLTSAVIGTLAVAGNLFALSAMADTSTTSVQATAPKLIDKITASYWGAYSGPSVKSPSARTGDSDTNGDLNDLQNIDSTLTLGYKLSSNLTLTGNYRFIYRPMLDDTLVDEKGKPAISDHYTMKDPWLALKFGKLVNRGGFNLSADLRGYIPVGTGAGKITTGLRSTQTATYDVPKTRLTLGTYTIERANLLKEASKVENFNLDLAAFSSYQMTGTLAATFWTDLLQYDIHMGTALANKPVDMSVGVNWDITPNVSVNPQFTFFPGYFSVENTTLGAILSAKFL